MKTADESFENRLQQIWQQGHRSMAAAFLRRAMTPQTTLADVAKALQFDAVRDFLDSLKLGDVLRDMPARSGSEPPAAAPTAAPVARAPRTARGGQAAASAEADGRKRRRRRGPKEMAGIKDDIRAMLNKEPGSLDTTQMFESLTADGHELDRLTLNRLLAQLEEEGAVVCLGGRPKSWRRADTGQRAEEKEERGVEEAEEN